MSATLSRLLVAVTCLAGCRPAPSPEAKASGDSAKGTEQVVATPPADSQPVPPCPSPSTAEQPYVAWNLPEWASRQFDTTRLELFTGLNPFYVSGLFDGDTLPDLAVQVREKHGGRRGVLIMHRSPRANYLLGAGTPVGNGGDDWSWLGEWRVVDLHDVGTDGARGHEALLVAKPESASGYLWWDGMAYQWTQGAD